VASIDRGSFTDSFSYDENGNMTCRVEKGISYKQEYNAENRISAIHRMNGNCATGTSVESWNFVYDGDGIRTTTSHDTGSGNPVITRYYFGGALETTGGAVTKYYSFAGQMVAMKDETGLQYFLTDHLGSVVGVTDSNGTLISQQRYLPFGEVRTDLGLISQTDFGYTAQRKLDEGMGSIMDYKARMYSPYINRFLQPDTIIPDLSNPQSWNRYGYVTNNPVRYSDPTGHVRIQDGPQRDRFSQFLADAYRPRPVWKGLGGNSNNDPPPPPQVPPSSPNGDPATPWDVGVEWLTGEGPRHHEFRDGDPFTELLQEHEHFGDVREELKLRLLARNYRPGEANYYLGGLQGVPKYFRDYSTLLTFGQTGNLAVTYLGSYELNYYVVAVDEDRGLAEVLINVENESTLASATHPPVIGYTDFWLEVIAPATDNIVPSGPMSRTTQSFWWTETIGFR
jgi:RHS repeat-associated protein